jgi:DNA-binding response OmpR family regulator
MRIAILDDDRSMLSFLSSVLNSVGHHCHEFSSGREMMRILRRDSFDMLILDWLVPDFSGTNVLHWVRQNLAPNLPVLFITNCTSEDEIVEGLNAGADDYIVKPVRKGEVVARVQALLRRSYQESDSSGVLKFGKYAFETRQGQASMDGLTIELAPKEFDLALLLFRNAGRPLSRSHILDTIWSGANVANSRSLDTHLSRLRSKLHLLPENGFRLSPVYGYGYRLEPTVQHA